MQVTETYDWRLAVPLMQQRDNYFTRLKLRVELLHSLHQTKVTSPSFPPASGSLVKLLLLLAQRGWYFAIDAALGGGSC